MAINRPSPSPEAFYVDKCMASLTNAWWQVGNEYSSNLFSATYTASRWGQFESVHGINNAAASRQYHTLSQPQLWMFLAPFHNCKPTRIVQCEKHVFIDYILSCHTDSYLQRGEERLAEQSGMVKFNSTLPLMWQARLDLESACGKQQVGAALITSQYDRHEICKQWW